MRGSIRKARPLLIDPSTLLGMRDPQIGQAPVSPDFLTDSARPIAATLCYQPLLQRLVGAMAYLGKLSQDLLFLLQRRLGLFTSLDLQSLEEVLSLLVECSLVLFEN